MIVLEQGWSEGFVLGVGMRCHLVGTAISWVPPSRGYVSIYVSIDFFLTGAHERWFWVEELVPERAPFFFVKRVAQIFGACRRRCT